MQKQIMRFTPHQNGKVTGILMAVTSFLIMVPIFSGMWYFMPAVDQHGNPVIFPKFIFLFPVIYLIIGYVATVIGSAIYNFLFKYIGGYEFEVKDQDA
ncbi:MAG: hypothetical protein ACYC9L_10425 [Sulfuricaulis sp.]